MYGGFLNKNQRGIKSYYLIHTGKTQIKSNTMKHEIKKVASNIEEFEMLTGKCNELTKDIPIIFLTVDDNEDKILKGFELGAVDYIIKSGPKNLKNGFPRRCKAGIVTTLRLFIPAISGMVSAPPLATIITSGLTCWIIELSASLPSFVFTPSL